LQRKPVRDIPRLWVLIRRYRNQ